MRFQYHPTCPRRDDTKLTHAAELASNADISQSDARALAGTGAFAAPSIPGMSPNNSALAWDGETPDRPNHVKPLSLKDEAAEAATKAATKAETTEADRLAAENAEAEKIAAEKAEEKVRAEKEAAEKVEAAQAVCAVRIGSRILQVLTVQLVKERHGHIQI